MSYQRPTITAADWQAEADRLAALPTRTRDQEDRMRSARARAAFATSGWTWPADTARDDARIAAAAMRTLAAR